MGFKLSGASTTALLNTNHLKLACGGSTKLIANVTSISITRNDDSIDQFITSLSAT